jgi:preprotein translocase subunit YajC
MSLWENTVVILGSDVIIGGEADAGANTAAGQTAEAAPPPAAASDEAAAANPFSWIYWVVIYGGLFVALWFFMIRPQRKKAKEAKEMQGALKIGESVVTTSGFFGKIVGVGEDSFLIEFGENRGVRVWVRKGDIAGIKVPVMTPPPAEAK